MSTPTLNGAIPALPEPRFDFPTWLPPMLVKELRQGLRTRGFIGCLVGFQVIMVIAFVWAFASNLFGDNDASGGVNGFFWTVLGIMLLVITPLRAVAGLRQEIEAKTLDLLMLTNLTAWRIVLGKWTSLLAQAALLVLALLPYGFVRYFFGSVDLVQDLMGIAAMYLGCGVLTALALWLSGLPRSLRIGIAILIGLMSQGIISPLRMGRTFFSMSPSASSGQTMAWIAVFNVAALLLFFLVQAVRRIAPPAENHSPLARGLALLLLLPVPLLAIFSTGNNATGQLWIAVVALALVTIIEISSLRYPMGVQVRQWWRRGRLGAWIGRLVLPGWPSAAMFTAFWLGLASVGALMGLIELPSAGPSDMAWLFVLLWAALVFPMVLLSFAPNLGRRAPGVYFILQATFGILSSLEANASPAVPINPVGAAFRWLFHVFPVSSFWLQVEALSTHPAYDGRYFMGQAIMVSVVVTLVMWRAAPYWHWVRTNGILVRREPKAIPTE